MGDESAFVLGLACCGTGFDERLELDELVRVVFEQRSDLRFGFSRPQRGNLRPHQRLVSMELGRFGCVRAVGRTSSALGSSADFSAGAAASLPAWSSAAVASAVSVVVPA